MEIFLLFTLAFFSRQGETWLDTHVAEGTLIPQACGQRSSDLEMGSLYG